MKYKVMLLFLGAGFGLLGIELFLRIDPTFGVEYAFFRWNNSDHHVMFKDPPNDIKYRPSPVLGYELVPNSDIHINSYGIIGREYKLAKDKDTYRILLLGDSIAAQGYGADFLEEKLNNNLELNKKYKFEIWNAGVPSYGVKQYANYLRYKGIKYKPDMVLIFFWLNDFEINTNVYYKGESGFTQMDFKVRELSKKYIPNQFLFRHSYLYRFAIIKLENYLTEKIIQDRDPREEDGRFYLGIIKDICNKNGLPLFGVIFCPLKEYENYQRKQQILISKVLHDLDMAYIDLDDYLPNGTRDSLRNKYDSKNKVDYIHPSKEGHKIIADIIYEHVLKIFRKEAMIDKM